MQALDLAVVAFYLLAVVLLSYWLGRQQSSADDYFVGGRRLPWWALGISTLATQSSANSFIGIPAFVALVPGGGLVWLQYELALPLALLVVMLLLVPSFRGLRLLSLYEYLELRFDRATRQWLCAVFLVSRALAAGVALYAAALLVQVCTDVPLWLAVLLMGGATVVYDLLGGMRAVVWTDVLQMFVLLLGLGLCIAVALQFVGGLEAARGAIAPVRLETLGVGHGLGDSARAPFWGFLVGGFVLYVAYYGVDQSQVQRQLAASSVGDAQRLLAANALARFPLTLAYALLGLALAAVWAHSPALREAVPAGRPDHLLPQFINLHLPVGLKGLLVAAILAAAMSSLDSALNSLSAAAWRDFISQRVSARRELQAVRLSTLFWGLLMIGVAFAAPRMGSSVIEAINRVGALFYGPLLAAFACGLLDRRATGLGVRCGVVAGLTLNLLLLALMGTALFWMWWNLSGLLAAALVCAAVSRSQRSVKPALPACLVTMVMLRTRWVALGRWPALLLAYAGLTLGTLLALPSLLG